MVGFERVVSWEQNSAKSSLVEQNPKETVGWKLEKSLFVLKPALSDFQMNSTAKEKRNTLHKMQHHCPCLYVRMYLCTW